MNHLRVQWRHTAQRREAMAEAFNDRLGHCYMLAGGKVTTSPGWVLVHGSIQGMGKPRIGHAWAITPSGEVWDGVLDQTFSSREHEMLFSPIEYGRWTFTEAAATSVRFGHWGPWAGPFMHTDYLPDDPHLSKRADRGDYHPTGTCDRCGQGTERGPLREWDDTGRLLHIHCHAVERQEQRSLQPQTARKAVDWEDALSHFSRIYRGYGLRVSEDDYAYIFDESIPIKSRANRVLGLLDTSRGLGRHWSVHRGEAAGFAGMTAGRGDVRVLLQAKIPSVDQVQYEEGYGIGSFDLQWGEQEVPLRPGARVDLIKVEWAPGGPKPMLRSDDGGGWQGTSMVATSEASLHGEARGWG